MNTNVKRLTVLSGLMLLFNHQVSAAVPPVEPPEPLSVPAALSLNDVPNIPGIWKFMKNKQAAIRLGKALFWDMAVGSDGQACASCHFHAGADNRIRNQLSPGLNRENNPDLTFQLGGPNYRLQHADFPLHKLSNPNDRHSAVIHSFNETVSSQGTFGGMFMGLQPAPETDDLCNQPVDPTFHVSTFGVRKVEPRNTPTIINSVFFFRTFLDGRANNVLNAIDPFGLRNGQALILEKKNGPAVPIKVSLRNAAVGSQSLGPPVNDTEMVCAGRSLAALGQKLLSRRALENQVIDSTDSVLGGWRRHSSGKGLKDTYEKMIKQAFREAYWKDTALHSGFTQMENNFSLFWSVALQMYQSTLVSDRTKFDHFARGMPETTDLDTIPQWRKNRLSAAEFRGLRLFMDKGKCISCHGGPEFSNAATQLHEDVKRGAAVARMVVGNGDVALYDEGFYNIGVTPTTDDIGLGGVDPFGNPLSFTLQYVNNNFVDPIHVDPCTFEVPFDSNDCSITPANLLNEKVAVRGAFKVPTLRNVELTGPYMHNGGMMTLPQVINFYNRGGNFENAPFKDPDITTLGLSNGEKNDLLKFLRTLTDNRVRSEKAPFDHPQLFVPIGQVGDHVLSGDDDGDFLSEDQVREVMAVGRNGRPAKGLPNLKGFLRNPN